jgi:hypothetical protein
MGLNRTQLTELIERENGGSAVRSGGYRMGVTVNCSGVLQLRPCDCGGKDTPTQ